MTTGHCMKCKKKQEMKDTKSVKTKNGRSAMKGKCCKCDTNMYVMLPNAKSSTVKSKSTKSKKLVKSKKLAKSKKLVKYKNIIK